MTYLDYVKEKIQGKKVCIYPMGMAGRVLPERLWNYGIRADFFSDKNSGLWGDKVHVNGEGTIVCVPRPQVIQMNQDEVVFVMDTNYFREIKEELSACGVKNFLRLYPYKLRLDEYLAQNKDMLRDQIDCVMRICADEKSRQVFRCLTDSWLINDLPDDYFEHICDPDQYFDSIVMPAPDKRTDEVFVDVGAYTGDSFARFSEMYEGNFESAYLFELNPITFKSLQENVRLLHHDRVICYPFGCSDQNGEVVFSSQDSSSSIIAHTETGTKGVVKKLDDVLRGKRVTFIKMDIEGAEMSALRGAHRLITTQRPKLAICIYHSPEDMLQIPLYLKKIVPEYQIYIRHYTTTMYETVCYAVCPEEKSVPAERFGGA